MTQTRDVTIFKVVAFGN